MKNIGVYQIVNLLDNKVYVGSSINLKSRKYKHFEDLKNNKHPNNHLQRAYNRDGEENFKWEVLETVYPDENRKILKERLLAREQYWLDKYFGENCYNLRIKAESNLGIKFSEESRKKMSRSNRRYFLGKSFSEEHRKRIGKSSIGRNSKKIININTGKIFENISEASKFHNTSPSHIGEVCSGKRKTCKGYEFKFLKDIEENPHLLGEIGKPLNLYIPIPPSRKGAKHSEETRRKLSELNKRSEIIKK